jgi:hypothetical protein
MKARLVALIERSGLRRYARDLKQHPDLLQWVTEQSQSLPDSAGIPERVYVALHGLEESICHLGNQKVFNALNKGYRFCATGCECRRAEQARKIKEHHAALSKDESSRRVLKQIQTTRERYGVENVMHVPEVVERHQQTNLERYGTAWAVASEAVREKIKATNLLRHGVALPLMSQEIRAKAIATTMERHGVPHTMAIARSAFAAQNGGLNPFEVPEIAERAARTMIERYGVSRALQNPLILAKMQDAFEASHGARYPMLVPHIREKIEQTVFNRYGRSSPHQAHINDDSYECFLDPVKFKEVFEGKSLREAAQFLGVAYDTARKWCERHHIDLPKSSYEDAIVELLRARGFNVKKGDRTVIAPYEIDILLPDQKLGIEFCGLYWHSEAHKSDPRYHLKKLLDMEAKGYRLLTIFEDEWVYKRDIAERRILNALGISERGLGARSLTVGKISAKDARDFLDQYHIQGGRTYGFANYAAYDPNGVPVGVMTFSESRMVLGGGRGGPVEMLRFATDGRTHPGMASRLFKTFVREYDPPSVISYADRRWSSGNLYRQIGFKELRSTEPGYAYFHPNRLAREYRFHFRKSRIKSMVEGGENMSESQIMKQLGYHRIWDCGSLKFVWTNK